MTLLVADGARSPYRRCVAKGCATVPEGDRILCPVHAQALAATVARQDAVPPVNFSHREES